MTEEKALELAGDRSLAYADAGNALSSTLVLFFHGVFGVGDASHPSPVLISKNVHYVAPTLPGWGNSSPLSKSTPYYVGLANDISALIQHLHPNDNNLKLYISGGSYGTVPAQMLYGAPFDIFPLGRNIAGCLLLAPCSPFRYHTDYTKNMTMPTYLSIGPPSQNIPFRLLQRLAVSAIGGKMKTEASAEKFIRSTLFDKMEAEELAAFNAWREANGKEVGEVEQSIASNVVKSVSKSWEGFMEVSDVLHSDWGFRPDVLDADHTKRPVLVVGSAGDTMTPDAMAKWLAATYKNSKYKSISGGHLAAMFHLNEIFSEFLDGVQL